MKRNRLFILGAGFSAAANVPLTKDLLAKAMTKFARECPGIYARVEDYAKQAIGSEDESLDLSCINLSDLCTFVEFMDLTEFGGGQRWCENGSRERLALRFYLAKTIVECTPSAKAMPELYAAFAAQLHEGDLVLSLNWDGLLEVALEAVGATYTYNFSGDKGIRLCKLHGSVNWRLGEANQVSKSASTLAWKPLGYTRQMMNREIYHSPELLKSANWQHRQPLGGLGACDRLCISLKVER